MGLFFKVSQAIQSEFNKKLKKIEDPEEFLHEFLEDLKRQEESLKNKREVLLNLQSSEEQNSVLYKSFEKKLNNIDKDIEKLREKRQTGERRHEFYISRQKRIKAHRKIKSAMSDFDDVSRYDTIKGANC